MERIYGVEYAYDKNGIKVSNPEYKQVIPFLNLKYAKDWIRKSAFDRAGEEGDFNADTRRAFAYDKSGKCIGGWEIITGTLPRHTSAADNRGEGRDIEAERNLG